MFGISPLFWLESEEELVKFYTKLEQERLKSIGEDSKIVKRDLKDIKKYVRNLKRGK